MHRLVPVSQNWAWEVGIARWNRLVIKIIRARTFFVRENVVLRLALQI